MGYKALGFVVWQGGKWYVRRRYGDVRMKLAVAAAGAAVVTGLGLAAASRQRSE
ncbi:MAG: hypothetical protein JOZ73_03075 [Solirubrobacterales bacterium]|nr:hypothetical protein [Solirubrobacterales bacterium]